MSVRELDGMDLVHALRAHGLYPISGHAVLPDRSCTCGAGSSCTMTAKHPVGEGWQRQTPEEADQRLAAHLDRNVGLLTGSVFGLLVLDVDGGEKLGYESLADLEARHGPLPRTVSWWTGSGKGEQRLFRVAGLTPRNSAGRLGKGVDIRGEGGYAVIPPSAHKSGGTYRWQDGLAPGEVGIAVLPESWARAIKALLPAPVIRPSRPKVAHDVSDEEREAAMNRARKYLEAMGPAISKNGGHNHTFTAACRAIAMTYFEEDAEKVFSEWNECCDPPWTERELAHKLQDALRKVSPGESAGRSSRTTARWSRRPSIILPPEYRR